MTVFLAENTRASLYKALQTNHGPNILVESDPRPSTNVSSCLQYTNWNTITQKDLVRPANYKS